MTDRHSPARIDNPTAYQKEFGWPASLVAKLEIYADAVRQWQKAVNLVAPRTLDDLWHRHFADSAQIIAHLPPTTRHVADLGSGGGFPGLIIALHATQRVDLRVTLVESDSRKSAFLRETARRMEIPVDIVSTRIESDATVTRLVGVDTVTARAFAPLARLFELASPLFAAGATGVFLKGESVGQEIADARKRWCFEVELHPSVTDPSGRIAVVRRVRPKSET